MSPVSDTEPFTRRGATAQEEVGLQVNRLGPELWKAYANRKRISDELSIETIWHVADSHSDRNRHTTLLDREYTWVRDAGGSDWLHVFEALLDIPSDFGRTFRDFHIYLETLTEGLLSTVVRVANEATELSNLLQTEIHSVVLLEDSPSTVETEWTDEKNRRRCELVDREIDGKLSSREQIELEALQSEMLAYRRKVAPLPLNDLRKMHQELLCSISDRAEGE